MSGLNHANSFRELVVYQKAQWVSKELFLLSASFPKDEMFSLTDQMRRSSRSIGAQIAEAWAKRRYTKHFISKLTDADGELQETHHWLDTALACGYLDPEKVHDIQTALAEIGRMLQAMMNKAELFCGPSHLICREDSSEYSCLRDSDH